MTTYFENLTIRLHIFYILNTSIKNVCITIFLCILISITVYSKKNQIYLLFHAETYFLCIILNYKNLKFKYLIDNIFIDF